VRRSVFYPTENYVDFITVRGFELAEAASPWAPPTADQLGLIGPNWAKGMIIEDNRSHDAKCSGGLDRQGVTAVAVRRGGTPRFNPLGRPAPLLSPPGRAEASDPAMTAILTPETNRCLIR
jgi:hypothetical protein